MSMIRINTRGSKALEAEAVEGGLSRDLSYGVRIVPFSPGHNRVTVMTYDEHGLVCEHERVVRRFSDREIAEAMRAARLVA